MNILATLLLFLLKNYLSYGEINFHFKTIVQVLSFRGHSKCVTVRSSHLVYLPRYAAANGTTLINHFAKLAALIEEHTIDYTRLWN